MVTGSRRWYPPTTRRHTFDQLETRALLAAGPLITEFMAINTRTVVDADGEFSDWIEIGNPTTETIDLNGWYLSDNDRTLNKWQFPPVSIPRGESLLVFASGKDRSDPAAPLHTNFRLDGDGEFLGLTRPDGQSVAHAFAPRYPRQSADVSYGLSADGREQGFFAVPTPGSANVIAPVLDPTRQVVINEIMYHPASEQDAEEYIELHNRGTEPVELLGWRLTNAVDFTFPDVTIPAAGYLVVAANISTFHAKYGGAPALVGPWEGRLSNSRDEIVLRNAEDDRVDRVEYADEGDWSLRERGPVLSGHRGWIWSDDHDGGGKSLELVDPQSPNEFAHNWLASRNDDGSPGLRNSVAAGNVARFIIDTRQTPPIPKAAQPVTVSTQIWDADSRVDVRLNWRVDGNPDFSNLVMRDDGMAPDVIAGDRIFSAQLPGQPDRTVVEYYIEAADQTALRRTWPAATKDEGQVTNALYQVIDEFDPNAEWQPGNVPVYYQIMTAAERNEFTRINRRSDAQMNATFISVDNEGIQVRHNAGVRIRGSGSRNATPPNNRINFPSDRPWRGVTALNLNVEGVSNQIAGSALFRFAGLVAAESKPVRMFSNGIDLFGGRYYVHIEPLSNDFASNHFPSDAQGNLYKGRRSDESPPGGRGAGLAYFGPESTPYSSYVKMTNETQADWSDVIHLTDVLNNAPDATYLTDIQSVVNVEQWLRFFAMNAFLSNTEGGLVTGDRQGDDYAMYRGESDLRFVMIPHDLDSILSNVQWGITFAANVPALNRLLFHPAIKPRYYQTLRNLADELLSEPADVAIEQAMRILGEPEINRVRTFLRSRAEFVRGAIPQSISAEILYPRRDAYYVSERPTIEMHGVAPADAQSLTVNGQVARLSGNNRWEAGSMIRTPVASGATWKYLDDGSNQGTAWRTRDFVPGPAWKEGVGQFGYGDGDERTVIEFGPDAGDKFVTTYFRLEFDVPEAWRYQTLTMSILRDDGAAVYINGTEVWRDNLVPNADFDTLATQEVVRPGEGTFTAVLIDPSVLVDGRNVIAVEIHQAQANTEDASFWFFMQGRFIEPTGVIPLQPGINRIVVDAMNGPNGTGQVISSQTYDFWYDDGSVRAVSGVLPPGESIWTAASGPYLVTSDVTVPSGSKLTIEPGTSVYFAQNTELKVEGVLAAQGQRHSRIRFTSDPRAPFVPDLPGGRPGLPDGPPRWKGIHFVNSMSPDNVIAHADIHFAQSLDGSIGIQASHLLVDGVSFAGTHLRMINGTDSSLVVRNSVFPDMFAAGESPMELALDNVSEHIKFVGRAPAGGVFIIQNNDFGSNKGHNDVIDIDSNLRSQGPIAQILNNRFHGAGDELLDLGGDVFVRGNVFRNIFKDTETSDRGYGSAISTGDAGANSTIVVAQNLFHDIDHAINLRNGATTIFENNTVVKVHPDFVDHFGVTNIGSVINLFVDEPGGTPGAGAYAAGNIFWDVPRVFGNVDQPVGTISSLQLFDNLVDADDAAVGNRSQTVFQLGTGNFAGDPRFNDNESLDFSLRPGSAAQDIIREEDLGWLTPQGIWITGEPQSPTASRSARMTVGGPGIFSYQFRINGGSWTEELPIGVGFDRLGTVRTADIVLNNLTIGEYTVEVRGRDFAGNWQSEPTQSRTWFVTPGSANLLINEVLANNRGAFVHEGEVPDAIELYNAGDQAINLRNFALSDRVDDPGRFVFRTDTVLAPGQYLVLVAGADSTSTGIHVGFSLDNDGEGVFLFAPPNQGQPRQLVDSVMFGPQVGNYSIGRIGPAREWMLNTPTIGAVNRIQRTGDPAFLRINEWLAEGIGRDDFIELYNRDPLPVDLGRLYITDELAGEPRRHQLSPLTIVAPRGYLPLIADGNADRGPNHVGFRLSIDQEVLSLRNTDGSMIDTVVYYPQTVGVSEGRSPDSAAVIRSYARPSPGWANGIEVPGDFDGDGNIVVADVELLCAAIRMGGQLADFDVTQDGLLDSLDLDAFLRDLAHTSYGDTNLDGTFNSADLVAVFVSGEYEDGIPRNSTWTDGDWDCDGDFGTGDLVRAFQAGRYTVAAIRAHALDPQAVEEALGEWHAVMEVNQWPDRPAYTLPESWERTIRTRPRPIPLDPLPNRDMTHQPRSFTRSLMDEPRDAFTSET